MTNAYKRNLSTPIPQTQQANENQVKNNAGGFVYKVSDKSRLERFLILGSEKGTYYVSEGKLTEQNVKFVIDLIKRDEALVRNTTVDISTNGRAYKNSPAIFVTALLFKHGKEKSALKLMVSEVCRTATHLFELCDYFELLGGWNRTKRSAVAYWYQYKSADDIAYQAVKYRQRNGWTHKDVFYLAHPWVDRNVANFIVGKGIQEAPDLNPTILNGFTAVQSAKNATKVLELLDAYPSLPWEAIPTQFHKDAAVWKKLFYNGALKGQALLRNVTRMARIGAFDDMVFARDYANRLSDETMIRKTRLHPLNFLNALVVYQEGQIDRKSSGVHSMYTYRKNRDWNTSPVIVDALNKGFHLAFKYTEPAGKRTLIALDISGSMDGPAAGLELTCAQVAGAMAMTIAKTEPYYMVRGFAHSGYSPRYGRRLSNIDDYGLVDLEIAPSMDLNTVLNKMRAHTMGGTDCSLPMVWATERKVEIDTFIVITDNETWAGAKHPDGALRDYRKALGIDARLIVVGVNATEFSIADPNDPGMLDIVGGDANLPRLIADFSAGRL